MKSATDKARELAAERPRVIGGADVAALLGLSKYSNAVDIYARLVHGVTKPINAQMQRGLDVEEELLESYRAFVGPAERCDFIRHPEFDWCGGHLDALSEECVVDLKSCNVWGAKSYGTPGTDEVPADVACQMNWYCWLTGRERWHIYLGTGVETDVGFAFTETALYAGDFDAELQALSMAAATDFRERHWLPKAWPDGEPFENKRIIKSLKQEKP